MKRGRPSERGAIQTSILEVLSSTQIPLTISSLAKMISQKVGRTVSWNTVRKYLDELVQIGKVQPLRLPHSKIEGKNGLTVYQLKK
ncbi:MAG: hypothetical protein QMD12_00365 [Candidatus Aenigmarchaeota archaeon]|nr:hypothetical protein [Candidatus Aenigmarchaeota archaeon]